MALHYHDFHQIIEDILFILDMKAETHWDYQRMERYDLNMVCSSNQGSELCSPWVTTHQVCTLKLVVLVNPPLPLGDTWQHGERERCVEGDKKNDQRKMVITGTQVLHSMQVVRSAIHAIYTEGKIF